MPYDEVIYSYLLNSDKCRYSLKSQNPAEFEFKVQK